MVSKRKARRKKVEYADYIGRIERTALSYGLSHHQLKFRPLYPNRRALHLFGRMLLPQSLQGLAFEITLLGAEPKPDAPASEELSPHVAHLEKYAGRVQVFAQVPPDYVPALSAAFHDRRLGLFSGRGTPLFRRAAFLNDLSFEEETHFVTYWGEALPELPVPLRV